MDTKHYRVIDKGHKRIISDLRKLNKSYTKVGFPENADIVSASKSIKGKQVKTKMSEVAMIAAFNNWGAKIRVTARQASYLHYIGIHVKVGSTITIPQREFMGSSFDESLIKLNINRDRLYKSLTKGTISVRRALSLLGNFMENATKKKIRQLSTPPNHPITIAIKKSDNPLIDTGQMLNSVSHTERIL